MKKLFVVIALLTAFPAFAGDPIEGIWKRTNLDAADPLTPFTQEYLSFGAGSAEAYHVVAKQTARNSGTYTMVDATHVLMQLTGEDPVTFEVRTTTNPSLLSLCRSPTNCKNYEAISELPDYQTGYHAVPAVKMAVTLSCDQSSRPSVIQQNLLPSKWESIGVRLYMPITTQCGDFGMTIDFTLLGDDAADIESYATVARVWKRGENGSWLPLTHELTLNYLSFNQYAETTIDLNGRLFGARIKPLPALF
jgi:hypothetical protein